jgi:hypothetical protein
MTLKCIYFCTFATILLVFSPGNTPPLRAQQSSEETAEEPEGFEAALNLIEKTLASDIHTASYYELVSWCRELGLEDTGTRQALQRRLYAYYRIPPPPAETEPEGKSRLLEIKSAKETQYFTIEQVDEDYVLLLGDVLVEIKEEEATHRIRAHRILLNETENILSAEGGIEYTLIKGTEEEVFRGERLTFDVDSWEGVFFSGGMEADRSVGGETIRFRFTGESISRLEGNTVVIDRGQITSCDNEKDPHYHIQARKIWVLAPNEWAILHAVLYVGRVPLLYLPFFFRPGDEFFFHPAIGYRDPEGQFVQTTTYLIGQKKRSSSALSFLAATEESTTQYELEREGLFLRPIPDKPTVIEEDRFLKVMLDLYSRLGVFAGAEGSFPKVDFKGGIARSRTVYKVEKELNGLRYYYYTPWIDENEYDSSWNKSYIFGLELPFRFGVESNWNLGSGPYRFSGRIEYFSDPYFSGDFYNRAEDTGLTRLAGIEPIEATTTVGEKQNLTWEISGKVDFSEKFDTPLVKTLSFTNINANLFWQSYDNSNFDSLDPEDLDADYDPARKFYYPATLRLPGISFQMLGDLLNFSLPSGKSTAKSEGKRIPPPTDLRPPGDDTSVDGEPEARSPAPSFEAGPSGMPMESPLASVRPPELKKSVPVSLQKTPLTFGLSYQFRPNATVEQTFNADDWKKPEDVTYDLKYISYETQGSSSLAYSLRILENVLSWNGNLALTGKYRYLNRQSVSLDEWNTELLNAQSDSQFNLKLTNGLDYFPLADDPIFGKTSLAYDLSWLLYSYSLNKALSTLDDPVYQGSGPEFTQETVGQHSVQAALRWRMFEAENSLSVAAQLYPRQGSLTGNLQFTVWLLTTTVNSVLQDPDSDWSDRNPWVFQPLVVRETLNLGENVRISEELQFDVNKTWDDGFFSRSLTSLNLWNLYGSLTYEWMEPQVYSGGTFIPANFPAYTPEQFLLSYVTLGYKLAGKDRMFWKNRIRMSTSIDVSWFMNIEQFTDNNLDFSLTFTFWLHKFLELSINTSSYNNRTFQYFPALATEVGREPVKLLEDLFNSFNFFDTAARKQSAFNLQSIRVDLTHYLHDWNLMLSYEGKPVLDEKAVPRQYEWGSTFSVILQWVPIPELRSNVQGEFDVETERWDISPRG